MTYIKTGFGDALPFDKDDRDEAVSDIANRLLDGQKITGELGKYKFSDFTQWASGCSEEYCDAVDRLAQLATIGGSFSAEAKAISESIIHPLLMRFCGAKFDDIHRHESAVKNHYLYEQSVQDREHYHL